MTEDRQPTRRRTAAKDWNWWLAGRSSRREYWLYVGLLVAMGLIFSSPPAVSIAFTVALVFVQIRRIHDFGRTGWWALAASVAPLVPLALMLVTTEAVATWVCLAAELIVVAWIGLLPGDRGENRFGPPPPVTLKRLLTGR